MVRGKLYGVSVGPGDPELLTLRAARILGEVDCVAAPDAGGTSRTALRIVGDYIAGKQILDCATPMTRDRAATVEAYKVIADQIIAQLDAGKSVAFITLGDASVYSTWAYLAERMDELGYDYEVVAGVTSFCAAAARLGEPLCVRSEQLLVVPVSTGDVAAALDVPGTKVFMKSGKHLGELQQELRKRGLAQSSMLVANCGLDGEEVVRDLDMVDDLPGYMSIVITKDNPAPRASQVEKPQAADEFAEIAAQIAATDENARAQAVERWNAIAKPIGSLGLLEDDVARIAALTGNADVSLAKRACVVMCADNGVVAQGVSQCGQDVTTAVADNVARGVSSACAMARAVGVDTIGVDMGMVTPAHEPGIRDCAIARGTGDISCGPAMTRAQAHDAIMVGIDVVRDLKERGYGIIACGEMGIGNTTTAAAMMAALFGAPVAQVTGRGAGLSDDGLKAKRAAIERALQVNEPDANDPLDVLAKLGGFDIAGLVGLYIGGGLYRVPVIIDGFISALAALVAKRLCPPCANAMLASHLSAEPAMEMIMEELGLSMPIQAGLRLGEGTGALCLIPLLDMALALYNGTTFAATGIDAYDPDLVEGGL